MTDLTIPCQVNVRIVSFEQILQREIKRVRVSSRKNEHGTRKTNKFIILSLPIFIMVHVHQRISIQNLIRLTAF